MQHRRGYTKEVNLFSLKRPKLSRCPTSFNCPKVSKRPLSSIRPIIKVSQTKRQVNAFIYVWTMLPTQSPFCTDYPYSTWRELPLWAFIVRDKDS